MPQIRLNTPELEVVRHLRSTEKSTKPDPDQTHVLNQTLEFHGRAGHVNLGPYHVSAARAVEELAAVGADVKTLLSNPPPPEEVPTEDDVDSVIGTESNLNEHDSEASETMDKPTWESLKALLPDYVKDITFRVDENDLAAARENLTARFPGVIVQATPTFADASTLTDTPVTTDSATSTDLTTPKFARPQDVKLQETSQRTVNRLLDSEPAVKHCRSLLHNLVHPPDDECFGYTYAIGHGWNTLPLSRKAAIAHARCIKGDYGEAVDDSCTNCKSRGYTCRAYHPSLKPLCDMSLGDGCQNCRVWDLSCDHSSTGTRVAPATPAHFSAQSLGSINSNRDRLSTRTPLTTTKRKPSLVDRMTKDVRIKGTASSGSGRADSAETVEPYHEDEDLDILSTIDRIRLPVSRRDVLLSMYKEWEGQSRIRKCTKYYDVQDFYRNLLALCVFGYCTGDDALQDEVLVRWQQTNFKIQDNLPDMDTIILGVQHLPLESGLRKWNGVLYTHLWTSNEWEGGSFEDFRNMQGVVDCAIEAVAEFLFWISVYRCRTDRDEDIDVLEHWCTFHRHKRGGVEEKACKEKRDRIYRLSTLQFAQTNRDIEDAKQLIQEHGGSVLMSDVPTGPKRKLGGDSKTANKKFKGKR
ncbi:hypothetical protein K491DRAFT_716946 [Lophiostoma macrostomum CBS 122681]|uniref:Zn(2)-C6 fungal-type domain-containing protein n=1 Tax=Lophiostoma macrostomum CBS 122681 TaxID=1314788 RepID=A0A6A6T677_9PLEO|nr:hypothetical protein K491DRAFT_716946 [Lophiostoma macrostomum CBS 122681]